MNVRNKNKIYHERQRGSYCRCHAINNLIGSHLVTFKEFDTLCDEYDKSKSYEKGTSRNKHYFINSGGSDNILGYCLRKKGKQVNMTHYDYYKAKQITLHPKSIGVIIYNRGHTYCARLISGKLHLIDSMRGNIQPISIASLQRRGLGVIDVYYD